MTSPIISWASLIVVLLVTGCADALVYGERTSVSLASVRLNDDPSQPVAVKLGFDRDVVLVAPALGGEVVERDEKGVQSTTPSGEAVSQFSTFTVSTKAPFLPDGQVNQVVPDEQTGREVERARLLGVQTRFASGEAARKIAGAPEVVAAFLGLEGSIITPRTLQEVPRLEAMLRAIGEIDDSTANESSGKTANPHKSSYALEFDPNNQRGTNAQTARLVLQTWLPDLPVSNYDAWELALGIQ